MRNTLAALFAAILLVPPAAVLANHHEADGAEAPAAPAMSTETTTIGELIGNPDTKAIIDTHLPGLSDNPQIAMASSMTLRQIAGFASGMISDEKLDAIDADLARMAAE